MIVDFHNHFYPPEYLAGRRDRIQHGQGDRWTRTAIPSFITPATTTSSFRAIGTSSIGPKSWLAQGVTCRFSP